LEVRDHLDSEAEEGGLLVATKPVLIVAEIGSNHLGRLDLAKDLISTAAQAGADIVKLQAFNQEIWTQETWEERKHLVITPEFAEECATFAGNLGLEFMCTPFYVDAVRWLDPLVTRWKIASADLGNKDLVRAIYDTGKQAFYSMGVTKYPYLERTDWIPLICVSRYPALTEEYKFPFSGGPWGLSDHTLGVNLAVAAVARGAQVIEKHLKLSQQLRSPDRDHSIGPLEFVRFVREIREIEKVLGNLVQSTHRIVEGRKVWE
jgi:sialic acid synthase SpsE